MMTTIPRRLVSSKILQQHLKSLKFSSFTENTTSKSLLKVGDVLSKKRVFTANDVKEYSKVSLDKNPIHFDSDFAKSFGFDDGPIVHGLLVSSFFPRLIASHFPGAVYVSQSLQFKSPVYIGDEIVGQVQAINVKELKKKYLVKFSTRCLKNDGHLVLDGEAMAILPTLTMEEKEFSSDNH